MAYRRGSFGRSPRPAASLTNVLVEIAREMQQQRDSNIINAWKNGGTFEGHQVTDAEVLKYWKTRASSLDKKDPLYDTYHEAYQEYDYSIHESKIQTQYAQGKINEQQAANFYLGWAKKVTKNSEFYRVLQRDAAQYLTAAKNKAKASAAQAAEDRYTNDQKSISDKWIKPGAYLTDVFTKLAQRGNRPSGGNPLINPLGGDLTQFDPQDVTEMLGMIDRLTQGGAADGHMRGRNVADRLDAASNGVLYHDDNGKPVTAQDVFTKLQNMGFKGNLTLDSLYTTLNDQYEGLKKAQHLAAKTGHLTDATSYAKQAANVAEVNRQVKAWPIEKAQIANEQHLNEVLNDPNSSQQDIIDATDKARATAATLAQDPAVAGDDVFRNKLLAFASGDASVPTPGEDFTGLGNVAPASSQNIVNKYDRAVVAVDAVNSGKGVWTTGEWDSKTNQFIPSPGGSQIGAAAVEDINNHSGGIPTQAITLIDKNGRPTMVHVLGQPITMHVFGADGAELGTKPGTNPVVANVFELNGKRLIQFSDGKGGTLYADADNPPWGQGATLTENSKGFDLSMTLPDSGDTSIFAKGTDGKIVYDPQGAMLSTDPEHFNTIKNGNGNPETDFRSPSVAYYSGTVAGQRDLQGLARLPEFQSLVQNDTYASTGFKVTGTDANGNPIWQGGDQSAYDRGMSGYGVAIGAVDKSSADPGVIWDRERIAKDLAALDVKPLTVANWRSPGLTPGGHQLSDYTLNALKPLASSILNGLDLTKNFKLVQDGTLNLNTVVNGAENYRLGETIKVDGLIKVPQAPSINPIDLKPPTGPFTGPAGNVTPQTFNLGGLNQPDQPTTVGKQPGGKYYG